MKLRTLILSASLMALTSPAITFAQAGSADMPSVSAGHIFIANRTNAEVFFYLTSATTARTEHRLAPNSAGTFTGSQGDSWFNIDVYTQGAHIAYGLNAGARHYLDYNSNGILDVYILPPH